MSIASSSHRVPWLVVTCAAALMLIGLSGIRRGDELTGVGDLADRQTIWILMGVPAMFATTLIPYRRYRNWSHLLFAFSIRFRHWRHVGWSRSEIGRDINWYTHGADPAIS